MNRKQIIDARMAQIHHIHIARLLRLEYRRDILEVSLVEKCANFLDEYPSNLKNSGISPYSRKEDFYEEKLSVEGQYFLTILFEFFLVLCHL